MIAIKFNRTLNHTIYNYVENNEFCLNAAKIKQMVLKPAQHVEKPTGRKQQ